MSIESSIKTNLGAFPELGKSSDPELYQSLLDIHSAIDALLFHASKNFREVTASDSLLYQDKIVLLNGSTSAVTLSLIPASDSEKMMYIIKATDITNPVTVTPYPGDSIDGSGLSIVLTANQVLRLYSTGITWILL